MSKILYILIALIVFSLMILVHEFGHFAAAKACGVGVIEFSLGMGPRLLSWKGRETRYSLKLFPFGGSCAMVGELGDAGQQTSEDGEAPDPVFLRPEKNFQNKKAWQRAVIIAAGPLMNFVLAFVAAMFVTGSQGSLPPVISGVEDGMPAQEAGLRSGDVILSIDGEKVNLFDEVTLYLNLHPGRRVEIGYKRDGEKRTASVVPVFIEEENRYMIGFTCDVAEETLHAENIFDLLRFSAYELRTNLWATFQSLAYMLKGLASLNDVMGPVGIVGTVSDTVETSAAYGAKIVFLTLCAYLTMFSANIGVMNLLPIPALDGGRLFFTFIEMIFGRPVDPKFENAVHFGGFVLLMLFMAVIMFKDVFQMIGGI